MYMYIYIYICNCIKYMLGYTVTISTIIVLQQLSLSTIDHYIERPDAALA